MKMKILAVAAFAAAALATCSHHPSPIAQRIDNGPPTTGSILLLGPMLRGPVEPVYHVTPTPRPADPAPVVQGLGPDDRGSRIAPIVAPAMPTVVERVTVVEDGRAASSRLAAGLITIAVIAAGVLAFGLAKRRREEA